MEPDPLVHPSAAPERARTRRLLEWLHRHRFALALASFGAGLASFLLIERQEPVAQWLSALLLASWLGVIFEEAMARRLRLPPAVLRYGIQAIQQETFFFVLPFFLHTTTWWHGQALFTAAACAAALCAMWDPLYYRGIASRPWRALAFHGFAVFVGTLVVAPMLLHLTTTETLALASASIGVLAVPSLLHLIDRTRVSQWGLMLAGAAALGGLAWTLGPWVPPATLWVREAQVSDSVDAATRRPGVALVSLTAAHLHTQGLYAWTSIRAPRGLRERIHHRWLHEGREVDRIALEIVGGRAEGYRAWSFKQSFPADPRGAWQIQVVTDGGQLIGQFGFVVVGDAARPAPAPRPDPWPGSELPPAPDVPDAGPAEPEETT